MGRLQRAILGGALGALLGGFGFGTYIAFKYPNYTRDSGLPPHYTGFFLGSPPAALFGLLVGALLPDRKKRPP